MFSRGVTLANMIRLRTEANSGSTHSVTGILCRPALPTAFKRPMLASIWKTLRRGGGLSPPLHVCRRRSLARARPTRLPRCPCQRHLMRGGAAGCVGAGGHLPGPGVCPRIQSSLLKRAGRIKWPTAMSKRATHRFHTHSAARSPHPSPTRICPYPHPRLRAHARAPASVVFAPARGRTRAARNLVAGAGLPGRRTRATPPSRSRPLLDHVAHTITPPAPPPPRTPKLPALRRRGRCGPTLAADVPHRRR